MSTRGTSFNEARREAPGSPLSKVCFRVNPDMRFNEARREAPGSLGQESGLCQYQGASMRPGAKRRDHGPDTGKLHHKQMRSTLRALAERPRCNT